MCVQVRTKNNINTKEVWHNDSFPCSLLSCKDEFFPSFLSSFLLFEITELGIKYISQFICLTLQYSKKDYESIIKLPGIVFRI